MAVHWIPRFPRWPFCVDWDSALAQGLRVCLPFHVGPMLMRIGASGDALRHNFLPGSYRGISSSYLTWTRRAGTWCIDSTGAADPYYVSGIGVDGWGGFTGIVRTNWSEISSLNGGLLSQWQSGNRGILFRRNSTALQFYSFASAQAGGSISVIPSSSEFSASELQTYAAMYDGAAMRAWVNGRGGFHAAQTGTLGEGTIGSLEVGGDASATSAGGLGAPIAEALVWDRALTSEEVMRVQMDGTALYYELGRRQVFLPAAAGGGTTYNQSVAGTVTPAGSLAKQTEKALIGSSTPTGDLSTAALLGALLVGSVTAAGSLSRTTLKALAGSSTAAGSVSKETQRTLAGSVTPAGALTKTTMKQLAGVVTATGDVAIAFLLLVEGSVTATGAVVGSYLAGGASSVGVYIRRFWRRFRR